jgi:hypothetical protein
MVNTCILEIISIGDEIALGTNYMVIRETQALHERMLPTLIEFEALMKSKMISNSEIQLE